MNCNPKSQIALLFVALTSALTNPQVGQADQPARVVRTFAYVAGSNPDAVPDFMGDDSILIKVEKNTTPADELRFIDSVGDVCVEGQLEFMDGTVWRRASARHLISGPERDTGPFYWLITDETPDVPPEHAFALTGAEGRILYQEVLQINKCVNGSCCNDNDLDGLFYVASEGAPSSSGDYFVIVTAEFSK